jgi:hypothetical protein
MAHDVEPTVSSTFIEIDIHSPLASRLDGSVLAILTPALPLILIYLLSAVGSGVLSIKVSVLYFSIPELDQNVVTPLFNLTDFADPPYVGDEIIVPLIIFQGDFIASSNIVSVQIGFPVVAAALEVEAPVAVDEAEVVDAEVAAADPVVVILPPVETVVGNVGQGIEFVR